MSRKRRNTSSPEPSPPGTPNEIYDDDYSSDDEPASKEKPQINSQFGQTGAFPGLGADDSNELFYGPANDGIGYLRMVRYVPHVSLSNSSLWLMCFSF
jgi:hypothetical protein